jgi:hypothetical protein
MVKIFLQRAKQRRGSLQKPLPSGNVAGPTECLSGGPRRCRREGGGYRSRPARILAKGDVLEHVHDTLPESLVDLEGHTGAGGNSHGHERESAASEAEPRVCDGIRLFPSRTWRSAAREPLGRSGKMVDASPGNDGCQGRQQEEACPEVAAGGSHRHFQVHIGA